MEQQIIEFVSKFPILAGVVMVLGVFRLVFKPFMSFVRAFVAATPSKKDDEALAKVELNPIYKGIAWLADYLFSIKLPGWV